MAVAPGDPNLVLGEYRIRVNLPIYAVAAAGEPEVSPLKHGRAKITVVVAEQHYVFPSEFCNSRIKHAS